MKSKSEEEMRGLLASLPVERIKQISEALDWQRMEEEKQVEESKRKMKEEKEVDIPQRKESA
eukprot:14362-Hanusia_phi.AAC.7